MADRFHVEHRTAITKICSVPRGTLDADYPIIHIVCGSLPTAYLLYHLTDHGQSRLNLTLSQHLIGAVTTLATGTRPTFGSLPHLDR
jgi:hypothetical protein